MADDEENIWLSEARELLAAARADRHGLEPALRRMCPRAFRDSRFPPSFVMDYLLVSTPSLFSEAGSWTTRSTTSCRPLTGSSAKSGRRGVADGRPLEWTGPTWHGSREACGPR